MDTSVPKPATDNDARIRGTISLPAPSNEDELPHVPLIDAWHQLLASKLYADMKSRLPDGWGLEQCEYLVALYAKTNYGQQNHMSDLYSTMQKLPPYTNQHSVQKLLAKIRNTTNQPEVAQFFTKQRKYTPLIPTEGPLRKRRSNFIESTTELPEPMRQKARLERQRHPNSIVPFPELVYDYTKPYLCLMYDEATTLVHGGNPPHPSAAVDLYKMTVTIPTVWRLMLSETQFCLDNRVPMGTHLSDYHLDDVERSTPIHSITDKLNKWLAWRYPSVKSCLSGEELQLGVMQGGSVHILQSDATAESTDLFNVMSDLVVITENKDSQPNHRLTQKRKYQSQGAGNNKVVAPPHLETTNNIIAGRGDGYTADTNLADIDDADFKMLGKHIATISEYPRCICFNVGHMHRVRNQP